MSNDTIDPALLTAAAIGAVGPAKGGISYGWKLDVMDAAAELLGFVGYDMANLLECVQFNGILRKVDISPGGAGSGAGKGRLRLYIESENVDRGDTKAGEIQTIASHFATSVAGKRMQAKANALIGHRVRVFKQADEIKEGEHAGRKTWVVVALVDRGPEGGYGNTADAAPPVEQAQTNPKPASVTAAPAPVAEAAPEPAGKTAPAQAAPAQAATANDARNDVPTTGKAIVAKAEQTLSLDRATVVSIAEAADLFNKTAMADPAKRAELWGLLCDHAAAQVTEEAEAALRQPEDAVF
ncbi:hypothetical protein DVS28_b0265 (plasmid) [Euzebya pacifica]|uniref:Uncharacterized protein n=1 Tax=Euzebya pacifica TaxID=1608957 RepID=A0A346Y6D8_9ACTN|nr:hypothetical protein [Euzebya pacifica]AXV10035.1 hypothetical protein DVS28_b0265 [Euzebya pacifica]